MSSAVSSGTPPRNSWNIWRRIPERRSTRPVRPRREAFWRRCTIGVSFSTGKRERRQRKNGKTVLPVMMFPGYKHISCWRGEELRVSELFVRPLFFKNSRSSFPILHRRDHGPLGASSWQVSAGRWGCPLSANRKNGIKCHEHPRTLRRRLLLQDVRCCCFSDFLGGLPRRCLALAGVAFLRSRRIFVWFEACAGSHITRPLMPGGLSNVLGSGLQRPLVWHAEKKCRE